jgi:xanthine dehydrogenase YagT iron-sulfur-binding subunit
MNDPQGKSQERPGVSRRQFLTGSGISAAASALTANPLVLLADGDKPDNKKADVVGMGPAPVKVSLNVNGKDLSTSVEPRTTLLDALRDFLNVTSCKRVCDRGTCGACTVMLDGRPVYSCTTLALEAQGQKIKTAEAFIDKDKLDAVPAAFVEFDAQQCGFCTPGFVVAMRAAFDRNPKATPAEIEEALSGNICRCGTYQQMRDAITHLCKTQGKEG